MDVEKVVDYAASRLEKDFHFHIGPKMPWWKQDHIKAEAKLIYMQLRGMEHAGFCDIDRTLPGEAESKNSFCRIFSVTVSTHHRGEFDTNVPFPSLDSIDHRITAGEKDLTPFRDWVADAWTSCGFVEHVKDNGDLVFEIPQVDESIDAFNKIEEVVISVADMRPLDIIEDDIVPAWSDVFSMEDHAPSAWQLPI